MSKFIKGFLVALALGVSLVSAVFYFFEPASAQLAIFYPSTCLGGWKNAEKASGAPEVMDGLMSDYNDENSASVFNTNAQIFCGNFQGEIPADTLQKRIVVKFSWTEINDEQTGSSEESIETEMEENTEENIENLPPVEENTEEVPLEKESEVPVLPTEETLPEAPLEEIPAEIELTVFNFIVSTAHAQTIETDDTLVAPTSPETESVLEAELIMPDARLKVLYTADGQAWRLLGFVKELDNEVSFEMPADTFTTVEDLNKAQVAIHTVPNYDVPHTIYLDSIWLEVEYKKLSAESSTLEQPSTLTLDRLEVEGKTESEKASGDILTATGKILGESTEIITEKMPKEEAPAILEGNKEGDLVNFADGLIVNAVRAEVISNSDAQRAFRLTADNLEYIPADQLTAGWVSWALVPENVEINDFLAMRRYAFDHFFGFTNNPENVLIDDGQFIPDKPARVVIFSWKCKTKVCDSVDDIPALAFISQEAVNYHTAPINNGLTLTPYSSKPE